MKILKQLDISLLGERQHLRADKHFKSLDLLNREVKPYIHSIESLLALELKFLPSHLKYIYLGDNKILSVIISSFFNANQEKSLVDVFERYKEAIG